jgi:ABC-type dipeptide/oligopeptide/nickel transport system permease subunit
VLLAFVAVLVAGWLGWLPDHEAVVGGSLQPPAWTWPELVGTDLLGRSVLFRIFAGAQTAVTVGLTTALIAVPLGTALGLAAAWFGGWVDSTINWLYTVVASIPDILLITAISYALGKGMATMCLALAATSWISAMRLVRGETLKHKALTYVHAARAIGAGPLHILWRQILPNVLHVVVVVSMVTLVAAIKAEVVLTYLGLGIQQGTSWGLIITAASQDLTNGVWWPLAATVLAMFLLIYSLSITGDALRDVLDPRIE